MDKQYQVSFGITIGRAVFVLFTLFTILTHSYGVTVYSTEFLRSLRLNALIPSVDDVSTLSEIKHTYSAPSFGSDHVKYQNQRKSRKRGKRGGKLVKFRARNNRAPLPSLIMSNVNSLYNKTDELFTRIRNQPDFRNCQVFSFSETWLTQDHPDNLIKPDGFSVFRSDRDPVITGKKKGGGVCFFVNDKWCTVSDIKNAPLVYQEIQ